MENTNDINAAESAPGRGSETREECRLRLIGETLDKVFAAKDTMQEAYRAKEWDNVALAKALIAEGERFIKKLEADAPITFPDGTPIGEWVVTCTKCHRSGRNPNFRVCGLCGGPRIPTVDYIQSQNSQRSGD